MNFTRLDINVDRAHAEVAVLREELHARTRAANAGLVAGVGAVVAVVAVGGEQFGEEAADEGSEKGETGADDGDVAFGCCPVGGADVAFCLMLGLEGGLSVRSGTDWMCRWRGLPLGDFGDGEY